jgi:hypothetical protein
MVVGLAKFSPVLSMLSYDETQLTSGAGAWPKREAYWLGGGVIPAYGGQLSGQVGQMECGYLDNSPDGSNGTRLL